MSAPSTDRPEADSREGAEALAETIRQHWRERGHEIEVEVQYLGERERWAARVVTPISATPSTKGRRAA